MTKRRDPFAKFVGELSKLCDRYPKIAMAACLVDVTSNHQTVVASVPVGQIESLLSDGLALARRNYGTRRPQ